MKLVYDSSEKKRVRREKKGAKKRYLVEKRSLEGTERWRYKWLWTARLIIFLDKGDSPIQRYLIFDTYDTIEGGESPRLEGMS